MIIVSFTTIPERLNKGLPGICISSILKQSIRPDYIIVNIPAISKKGELYSDDSAKKLRSLSPIVKVQFGIKDQGPITKIVPTLNFLESQCIENAWIILVDDDCTYDFCMIETLIKTKTINPGELVIGTAGRIKKGNKLEYVGTTNYNKTLNYNRNGPVDVMKYGHIYVDIIETFAGVLYDYSLFKNTDFLEWVSKLPDFVMLADDIILSEWGKRQGVKLYKIIQNKRSIINHDPMKTTELNTINDSGGNNDKVCDFFEDLAEKERLNKLINASKNKSFSDFTGHSSLFQGN